MPLSGFIEKQIALYQSLQPCFCPVLDETVYFTSEGLHHLLFKKRRPRPHNERHNRAHLISHLVDVIAHSKVATKRVDESNPRIVRWNLELKIKGNDGPQLVKVIVQKKGNGQLAFLSTMRKKLRS